MAITQGISLSFKAELMRGVHDFRNPSGDIFKMALYPSSATLDPTITAYTATGEITGTGYTAGGIALTIPTSPVYPLLSGNVALIDFNDAIWVGSTIANARGALIYNSTPATGTNPAVVVLDFGSDKSSSAGDFTVVFPLPDSNNAVVRVG